MNTFLPIQRRQQCLPLGRKVLIHSVQHESCTEVVTHDHHKLNCSLAAIPPVVGEGYGLVVFDPPHVNFGANAVMSQTYGHHTTEEIRDVIKRSAKEAHRVSKLDAFMAFKWNDHDQQLDKVLAIMAEWWEPLFGQLVAQRTKHECGTYWVMLRRK